MNDETIIAIPEALENMQLPNPSLLNFYKDAEERIFWIDDNIGYDTLEVVKDIMRINLEDEQRSREIYDYKEHPENYEIEVKSINTISTTYVSYKRKPIKLFINTFGGDVQVMWTLINAIKMSKTPVYTIVYCNAMSAGAHILAAGHKRFAFPGATILVHSGSCALEGDIEKVESAKKYYDKISKQANDTLVQCSKINPSTLKRKGAADWYMSAEEALENGLIDKVISDFSEVM